MVVNLLQTKCDCGTKERGAFRLNQVVEYDPTRTITLRNQFVRDMEKRFNWVKKQVWEKLVTEDFLAPDTDVRKLFGLVENAKYPHSASKIRAFKRWVDGMLERGLLESGTVGSPFGVPSGWTDPYIEKAYRQGVKRARQELTFAGRKAGSGFSTLHADELSAMETRAFSEVEGVSKAVSQKMSRTLSQGIAEGRSPSYIARQLNKVAVDKLGVVRGRTIARTETIRAHHLGNIEEYAQAGVEGVEVKAEWVTAGTRVCQICQALEGTIWKLSEIKGAIPAHANCRCVAVPVVQAPRRRGRPPARARYDRIKRPQSIKGVAGRLPACVINADGLEINVTRKCLGKKDLKRVEAGKKNHKPATKAKQVVGEKMEHKIAKIIKGVQQPDKEPFDVIINGKHLIEVKANIESIEDRVPMRKGSRLRKIEFFENYKKKHKRARAHVISIDVRGKKPVIYYRENVGAWRYGTMEIVNAKRLKEIFGVK